jgi:hypothetical protein
MADLDETSSNGLHRHLAELMADGRVRKGSARGEGYVFVQWEPAQQLA